MSHCEPLCRIFPKYRFWIKLLFSALKSANWPKEISAGAIRKVYAWTSLCHCATSSLLCVIVGNNRCVAYLYELQQQRKAPHYPCDSTRSCSTVARNENFRPNFSPPPVWGLPTILTPNTPFRQLNEYVCYRLSTIPLYNCIVKYHTVLLNRTAWKNSNLLFVLPFETEWRCRENLKSPAPSYDG